MAQTKGLPWRNLGKVGYGILVGTEDRLIAVFYGSGTNPQSETDVELAIKEVNKALGVERQ